MKKKNTGNTRQRNGDAMELKLPLQPGPLSFVFGDLLFSVGIALILFSFNSNAATTVVITAQNFSFSPSSVSILVGDSVSFNNAGGDHNVTGYNPAPPPERFCGTTLVGPGPMCTVTFTNAGVFQFRCLPHSSGTGTNFSGMIGSITVMPPPVPVVVPGQSFVIPGGNVTLSLSNTLNVPSTYQWRFNSTNLPGATSPSLALTSVTTNQSGSYSVTVSNGYQVVTATASVQVVTSVVVTSQPKSVSVPPGTNVTLSVDALSPASPIAYQWHRDGTNLPGQTNASLTFTNVQFNPHTSYYRVLVSDTVSNVWSETATLVVMMRPAIVSQPVATTVLQGGTATFSIVGTPDHPLLPLTYRWVRNGTTFLSNGPPTLVITNCQTNANFRCQLINAAGNINSAQVPLTVLPDSDRDGMADEWEIRYGFDTNTVADATVDSDGDGLSNGDEYLAGTNPTNAVSTLKLQIAASAQGQSAVTFLAVSNRTYTVEWTLQLTGGTWTKLLDVLAQPAERTESVTDTNTIGPARFYRVVTPRRP